MRRRFIPLLFSIAGLGIVPSTVRCAVVPSVKESAFRMDAGLRYSPEVEEETRVLRQSLFKNPFLPLSEPRAQPAPPKRAPAAQPKSSAPKSRPLVIAPPPVPREILLAEKELLLEPAADTPYDRYSGSVRTVIAHLDQRPPNMARACELMNVAHDFRYRPGHPYLAALPETTAATRAGDCKAKSLWLYDQLGDPSAFYVIGKTFEGAKSNHAWIYWRYESRWWILDPTNRSRPVPADNFGDDRYVPYYSFGKRGAYRHPRTYTGMRTIMAGLQRAAPAVSAPGGKSRVARR